MALTESQRQQVAERCQKASASMLWNYIIKEDSPADRETLLARMKANGLQPEKIAFLEGKLHQPDPEEQQEWAAIETLGQQPTAGSMQIEQKLKAYLTRWEPVNPYHNHIDDARRRLSSITEFTDFQKLDRSSYNAILSYLAKHPHSAHFQELDDDLWAMVDFLDKNALSKFLRDMPQSTHRQEAENAIDDAEWNAIDHARIGDLETFIITHPQSRHVKEAREIIASYAKWDEVQSSGDIFVVHQYIIDYPSSPFKQNADLLMLRLKQNELDEMHKQVNQYDTARFDELIARGIFNIQTLVNEGLITHDSYGKYCTNPILPKIEMDESKSIKECPPDRTDVFFFGIPSTGKTCILMGLLNKTDQLDYDSMVKGGKYADALKAYAEAGRVPPSTYGTFTTVIKAEVKEHDKEGNAQETHPLNLIEMSGEEFAFQIVKNPHGKTSFEQMGSGATNILKNKNRKVVFIIIDPTAVNRKVRRPLFTTDQHGNKIPNGEEEVFVSQSLMLKNLFDLFRQPENEDIVKLIDSFHFIMAKADLLGDDYTKQMDNAIKIFKGRHNDIIQPIKDWCKANGINNRWGGNPWLFPFSLGKFYIGDIFDYNGTDASTLIRAIINDTIKVKVHKSIWRKLIDILNKPII